MINIFLYGSKYLLLILFAVFVLVSFTAQRDAPYERKKGSYISQEILVIFVHLLFSLIITINIVLKSAEDVSSTAVYSLQAAELIYFIAMLYVIPHFLKLNRGLNNVMCMFLCISFALLTRLSFSVGERHFIITVCGMVLYVGIRFFYSVFPRLSSLTWIFCAAGLALLMLVLVLAQVQHGSKLSIDIGYFSFMPMEFVKILYVMFIAAAFYKATDFKHVLLTAAFSCFHILILVFCKDLGSALIIFVVYMMMLYVATKKFSYVFLGTCAFAAACVLAYFLFSHVRVRIFAWLDPFADIADTGYQISQSLFAIGTGSWFGSGLYEGYPESVPEVYNDFIFSAIAEELGTLFSVFLILLCMCFSLMIYRVAMKTSNPFCKLCAFGLGSVYAFQAFLTIGGAIKFIPSTGVNLPFISSGGSSLIASFITLALVQSLDMLSRDEAQEAAYSRESYTEGIDYDGRGGYEGDENYDYGGRDEYEDDEDNGGQKDRVKKIDI